MQLSVPTCSESKFHFVVQHIANIQHAAAQAVHRTETGNPHNEPFIWTEDSFLLNTIYNLEYICFSSITLTPLDFEEAHNTHEILELGQWDKAAPVSLNRSNSWSVR